MKVQARHVVSKDTVLLEGLLIWFPTWSSLTPGGKRLGVLGPLARLDLPLNAH